MAAGLIVNAAIGVSYLSYDRNLYWLLAQSDKYKTYSIDKNVSYH